MAHPTLLPPVALVFSTYFIIIESSIFLMLELIYTSKFNYGLINFNLNILIAEYM